MIFFQTTNHNPSGGHENNLVDHDHHLFLIENTFHETSVGVVHM